MEILCEQQFRDTTGGKGGGRSKGGRSAGGGGGGNNERSMSRTDAVRAVGGNFRPRATNARNSFGRTTLSNFRDTAVDRTGRSSTQLRMTNRQRADFTRRTGLSG